MEVINLENEIKRDFYREQLLKREDNGLTKIVTRIRGCAIARALVTEASVILADEPTGSLDSKNGMEIMDLLIQLNKSGKTVVIVTHDETIAKQASRTVYLKDGKIDSLTL